MKAKRGMIFGTFDGLHDGHRHFISNARSQAETLIVVVATDAAVTALKGRSPTRHLTERMRSLSEFDPSLVVVKGDDEIGVWHILDEHDPDRIFLGYDQAGIGRELRRMGLQHTFLDAYKPESYKSSLLDPRD